ncbi:MAG: T9SS type A sorting domain-containing protein, partial [Flavobacterium sp.]|nr:T9SS type A sorting domain-containing protein [Flavobacterium sp.]
VGTSAGPGLGYGVAHQSTSASYSTAGIINARNNSTVTGSELTFNANNVINLTTDPGAFQNVNDSQYWIGRSEGWDGSLDGRVGEIITLSSRATNIEKSNIQSYLAIKYGITLGVNGTSLDYTNSDGNKIWDIAANAGYNYDIAGIGRDDISRLNQKQSRSINSTEVMTIGLTDILATNTANTSTFATDKSYLVWGANGQNMANSGVPINVDLGPTTITTITEVVNRKWKVVETGGDVGITRINVPTAAFISGLPALGPTDAYVMVVATNSAFTSGVETVFMTTSGANQTCQYDFDNTKFITFGVAHQAVNPLHITLDGVDDFVRIGDANEIGSAFTIMTWIRPNGANTLGTERTILAKKATATTGYRLVLQLDNRVRMEWRGAAGINQSAISNTVLPNAMWHNIAVTYGAGTLRMYIDGVLDRTSVLVLPPVASVSSFSIGAQYINKTTINNLFKGDIDELRMWNRMLSATEIRFIMNQEISQTGTGTRGAILPATITKNDINALLWNDLFAYYSMNSYIGTHLDDDSFNINRGSLVIPDKISINQQTAPLPYRSNADGLWSATATWQNGSTQDLPYSLSIVDGVTPIDWNIVGTSHNVSSTGNKTLLGLYVIANALTANNDSKIEVSHYLKVDGTIDLEGKSQLVQTLNSDLDPTSSGSLQRDQQGQNNIYNYNYWSSPVGAINNTTNNNAYTVSGVMKDGSTSTPQNITWTSGLNGSATSPITLSSYWIFKFQNLTPSYANWQWVGPSGSLFPGQGYTLKGSGSGTSQNYTFVGKPNNGQITGVIAPNNLNLSGNPYASAIDANAFITANSASTTGALYFWEHYSTNTTHNLAQYQGGYAARTLVGGTPPVAPPGISGLGSSSKVPGRYIPVGQGFFVFGSAAGGNVVFNNDQRAFIKEDNASSNTLFRGSNSILTVDHFNDNSDDEYTEDSFARIRLGLDDRNGYHRQILLGFMNENATEGVDFGYDAILVDNQPSDMYFNGNGTALVISGVGTFDVNSIYPLAVKTDALGTVTFRLDALENFADDVNVYIFDKMTETYHDIKNGDFSVELPQGTNDIRFSLRFMNAPALATTDFENSNAIQVAYTSANDMLNIKNNVVDATVEKVELYNMLGQAIGTFKVENQTQNNIQLPIKNISTGTYIVKIKTTKGDTSRKIIIN